MAQAECLILIQVFFWHCCYVDLSSPVCSLVSLGFNFDLTGFSSIMHYLGIYFIPFGVSLQGVFRFSAILLSLLSLHRPLGTTVVPILCFSPESVWKWRYVYGTLRKGKVSWTNAAEGNLRWLIYPSALPQNCRHCSSKCHCWQ